MTKETPWAKNPILKGHVINYFQKVTGADQQFAQETALDEIDNSLTYWEALDEIDRKFSGKEIAYFDEEIEEATARLIHEDRPQRSQTSDEARYSKKIVYGGSSKTDIDKWRKNPSNYDFEGIDTPGQHIFGKMLSDSQRKIIDVLIHNKQPLPISRIAALSHIGTSKTKTDLDMLEKDDLLVKRKSKARGNPFIYRVKFPFLKKKHKRGKKTHRKFKRMNISKTKFVATCPPGTRLVMKELKRGPKFYCIVAD